MNLKGTQTEKNLKAALAGESMARNRYTFFAEKAKEEGLDEVEEFFSRMATNEKEHARLWYKILHGEVADTLTNLEEAATGEHEEWTDMYVRFSKQAAEEGFTEISHLFSEVKRIERNHERENLRHINKIKESLKNNEAKSNQPQSNEPQSNMWICGYCGFSGESLEVLAQCPLCKHATINL